MPGIILSDCPEAYGMPSLIPDPCRMTGKRIMTHCHVVLIGINTYEKKPLRGSVQDVRNMEAYLKATVGLVNVRVLTATGATEPGPNHPLIEDPKSWPTERNIRGAFEDVVQSAEAGDSVYIHYSGHGTRELPNDRSYNNSTGDLALVVLSDETRKPERCLYGRSLAYSLNAMVAKGLVVTLVLDCCFSASVYRSDSRSRFLPYDAEFGSKSQSIVDRGLQNDMFGISATRDVSMLPNWLINPDKYAILAACGPNEEAGEIDFPDGKTFGKLSYFLLKILKEDGGIGNTVNHIYERLRAEFHAAGRGQSPVLYGNKGQSFLGVVIEGNPTRSLIASRTLSDIIELQAGLAHGVGVGDLFALNPLDTSAFATRGESMIARVIRARAFTSDIEHTNMQSTPDQRRWMARPLNQSNLRKYAVRVAAQLSQNSELQTALNERSLDSHLEPECRPFSFKVTVNEKRGYDIGPEDGEANTSMPVSLSNDASIDKIGDTLEHLARFKLVKDVNNATSPKSFQSAFEIYITYQGNRFDPGSLIRVNEGDTVELNARNKSACDLYLATYDLGPLWQVENIARATFTLMAAADNNNGYIRRETRRLKMKIPPDMRETQGSCSDIVKVFITSHPTSFDFLELPRLGEPTPTNKTTRGSHDGGNSPDGEWLGLSFQIRTSRRSV